MMTSVRLRGGAPAFLDLRRQRLRHCSPGGAEADRLPVVPLQARLRRDSVCRTHLRRLPRPLALPLREAPLRGPPRRA